MCPQRRMNKKNFYCSVFIYCSYALHTVFRGYLSAGIRLVDAATQRLPLSLHINGGSEFRGDVKDHKATKWQVGMFSCRFSSCSSKYRILWVYADWSFTQRFFFRSLGLSFLRTALWGRGKKIACDALMICEIGSLMSSFVIISVGFRHAGQFQGERKSRKCS